MTRVREGAIASRIGYAAPMEEINMEGEVEIHATEDDNVEQFTEENRNAEEENGEAAMMPQPVSPWDSSRRMKTCCTSY